MALRDVGKMAIAAVLALSLGVPPAVAGDRDWHDGGRNRHDDRDRGHDRHYDHDRGGGRRDYPGPRPDYRYGAPPPGWYSHGGYPVRHWDVPPARRRVYRDVVVVRPYGHWYGGYGHYRRDDDAIFFLSLTAITLLALNNLNESQQRAHEEAQIRATTAPVGQPVIWSDGPATGAVTTLREGHTPQGAYCREFQQQVTIGGRTEDAYGTACRQPDGSWQVVG